MRKRYIPMVLVTLVGAGACVDDVVQPLAPEAARFNAAGGIDEFMLEETETDRHMVVMEGQRIPKDFATRVEALGGSVLEQYAPIGVAVVRGLTPEAASALQSEFDVFAVEPDLVLQWVDPVGEEAEEAAAASISSHASPTTASFYPRQWNMRAIGADQVWAAGHRGSSKVKVAILDTGLDYTYPDLAGRVDLSRSKSFVTWAGEDQLRNFFFPGMHEVIDMHGHGSHVGSTVVSNGHVVAGVTQDVTLIGVKVLSAAGSGATSGVLAGIMYAADVGADVINMSLGTRIPISKDANPGLPAAYNRALNYAHRKGAVMVVSAGNENMDLDALGDGYKPYCTVPNTVCVSAVGPISGGTVGPWVNVDTKATYSNFGRTWVDVAAPGGHVGGSIWAACSKQRLSQNSTTLAWSRHTCSANPNSTYVIGMSGTSMAAPHVSGLAALLVERHGRNPSLVANRLHQTGDDLGERGTDPIYGKGRVNAARATGVIR
jgi:lantibiotic leader peptide-processing serine protease